MCLIDVLHDCIDDCLEEKQREEAKSAFDHFIRVRKRRKTVQYTVHHMRLGYNQRRRAETKRGKTAEDVEESSVFPPV